jgi:pyroglutamyl-peptidase
MRLLLTGFEPFGGSQLNASEQVVVAFAAQPPSQVELVTAILPVSRQQAPQALVKAIADSQPQAVLCLGEAQGRAVLSIERAALNLLDFRIPDNEGEQAMDEPVLAGGPAAYFVTLPVRRMLQAVVAAGVPAELSLSAGSYLCNQVLYTLLHHISLSDRLIPAGFIHLPLLPEQAAARQMLDASVRVPSMSLETMVRGIRAAIEVLHST